MQSKHLVHANTNPRRIIVLNWTLEHDSLIDAFADFSPPGTEVVFVGQEKRDVPSKVRSVKFREVSGASPLTVCLHLV
jgi:hypothetical protein